jgi:uncharacterized protein (UPF0332 family)
VTPLEEAQQLLTVAAEETQYRTVASRAYFAAFNRVKVFGLKFGFQPVYSGSDHKTLAQFLAAKKNSLLRRIGQRLSSMRTKRNRADYDHLLPFTQGYAQNMVQDADQIEQWIVAVEKAAQSAPQTLPAAGGTP